MADNLNLVIGADVKELQDALAKAQTSLNNLQNTVQNAQGSVNNASGSVGRLGDAAEKTSGPIDDLKDKLGPAALGAVLVELGRKLIDNFNDYGSVSAAVRALTGDLTDLEETTFAVNNAIIENSGKVTKNTELLNLLANASENAALGARTNEKAQSLLRQEVDKIVVSRNLEKEGIDKVDKSLLQYTKDVLQARIVVQAYNSVIAETGQEYVKTLIKGVQFNDFLFAAADKISTFINAVKSGNIELAKNIAQLDFAEIAQKRFQKRVDDAKQSLDFAIKSLGKYTDEQIKSGKEIDDVLNLSIKTEDESEKSDQKRAKARTKRAQTRIKEIKDVRQELEFLNVILKTGEKGIVLPETGIQSLIDRANAAKKLQQQQAAQQQFLGLGQIGATGGAIERSRQQITSFIASVDEARAASLNALQVQGENIATIFGATLGPAIDGIFEALASGQDVIKNLGQVFKKLLIDIAATVIKTLALQAILAALSGGASAGVTAAVGGAASLLRGVTGAAGGVRRVAAPTFSGGAGINAGGLQLAGQVVFVQRGPDLVGVLNQGNARIGRVG
jgi:chromosome segregation ATPase